MTDKAEDVIDSLHEAEGLLGNECECMNHEDFCSWCSACKAVENARDLLASQAAEIDALRKALATIAFQSTDMPGAAVGAGDGFYRGYVFDMIGTAARALSGDAP